MQHKCDVVKDKGCDVFTLLLSFKILKVMANSIHIKL